MDYSHAFEHQPDINELLQGYKDKNTDSKSVSEELKNRTEKKESDAMVNAKTVAVRELQRGGSGSSNSSSNSTESNRNQEDSAYDNEFGKDNYDVGDMEYQKQLSFKISNAVRAKNAQQLLLNVNQGNQRKGLNYEVGENRTIGIRSGKMRMSTIAIPQALYVKICEKVGSLSSKVKQDDLMTGFLYWWLGKPEDVYFEDKETEKKILEVANNLDQRVSPANMGMMSYNQMDAILDKIDTIKSTLESMNRNVEIIESDTRKTHIDIEKLYISSCYDLLTGLAFTPPIGVNGRISDIDLMAGGGVWELMNSIDAAHNAFGTADGRRIYMEKMRKKVNTFNYGNISTEKVVDSIANAPESDYDYDAYDYDDADYSDYGIDSVDEGEFGFEDAELSDVSDTYSDDFELTLEDRRRRIKNSKNMQSLFTVDGTAMDENDEDGN